MNEEYIRRSVTCPEKNKPKMLSHFVLGDKLGQGTFGFVRLGKDTYTGERVAIKELEKAKITNKADKVRIDREIKILKSIRHNNIIQLFSVIQTPFHIFFIMEYASGRELLEYITEKQRLSEAEACRIFHQLINGVDYCHKMRIVHRDIKPENLLLDNKNNLKIVDFGLSNLYAKGELLSTACGSPCYAAPEMLKGKKYKPAPVDIWACGVVLFTMLCGYLPFVEENNEQLYKKISEGRYTIPHFVSENGKSLLKKLLNINPNTRITVKQIQAHPWYALYKPETSPAQGLFSELNVIPIDEKIVTEMQAFGFTKAEIRESVLMNKHDSITTVYYLLIKRKMRRGAPSISDLQSAEYNEYINNPENLMSKYNYDMQLVLKERKSSKSELDIEKPNGEEKVAEQNNNEPNGKEEEKPLVEVPQKKPKEHQMSKTITQKTPMKKPITLKKIKKSHSMSADCKASSLKEYGFLNRPDCYEKRQSLSKFLRSKNKSMSFTMRSKDNEQFPLESQRLVSQPNKSTNIKERSVDGKEGTNDRLTTEVISKVHKKILSKTKDIDSTTKKKATKISNFNNTKSINSTVKSRTKQSLPKSNSIKNTVHLPKSDLTDRTFVTSDTQLNKSTLINKTNPKLKSISAIKDKPVSAIGKIKPFKNHVVNPIKSPIVNPIKKNVLLGNNNNGNGNSSKNQSIITKPKSNKVEENKEMSKTINISKSIEINSNKTIEPNDPNRKTYNKKRVNSCEYAKTIDTTPIHHKENTQKTLNSSCMTLNKTQSINNIIKPSLSPFDLSSIMIKSLKDIKDSIVKGLNASKIKYKSNTKNGLKYTCDKNVISFDIEIVQENDIENAYIIKFKSNKGPIQNIKEIQKVIMGKVLNC